MQTSWRFPMKWDRITSTSTKPKVREKVKLGEREREKVKQGQIFNKTTRNCANLKRLPGDSPRSRTE